MSKLEPIDPGQLQRWFRSDVQSMTAYQPGEQPPWGKTIKLNTNENPYPPTTKIREAIAEAAGRLERYPDPLGTPFRMQAAQLLGVEPDQILCGNGSDDILTIVTRSLLDRGQLLRFPYPSYILYRTLAQLQGAVTEEVPFAAGFRLPEGLSAPHPQLRLVVIPNPNSPSGTWIAPEALLDLARRLPCPLLIDEAYVDFAPGHCIDLIAQQPNIMVSRTLSKSYGLAGLRFGYLVARPEVIQMMRKVKDSYNCDALSLAAATTAVSDQGWVEENRRKIVATRQRMLERARAIGFIVPDSHANFIWCTHPTWNLKEMYQKLKDQRVLVRYMDYPDWGAGLRISVGTDAQSDACMDLLESMR